MSPADILEAMAAQSPYAPHVVMSAPFIRFALAEGVMRDLTDEEREQYPGAVAWFHCGCCPVYQTVML